MYLACVLSILLMVCVYAQGCVFTVVCHGLCAWCCVLRVSDWRCVSSFVCPALYTAWYCLTLHVWHCVPRVWTWHFELRVCAQHWMPSSVFPEFGSCCVHQMCAPGMNCHFMSSVLWSQRSGLVWGASRGCLMCVSIPWSLVRSARQCANCVCMAYVPYLIFWHTLSMCQACVPQVCA